MTKLEEQFEKKIEEFCFVFVNKKIKHVST